MLKSLFASSLVLLSLSSCCAPLDAASTEPAEPSIDSSTQPLLSGSEWASAGKSIKIYDPSVGETSAWYFNDHSFIRDPITGTWHLFGITDREPLIPLAYDVDAADQFGHATAPSLSGPWTKRPFALTTSVSYGETHLWAPHVILSDGTYYMFYAGGGSDQTRHQINLATSTDLFNWTRRPAPLFRDGYQARDPMVIRVGQQWVMYYTATSNAQYGNHVVAYRTSSDLLSWSDRKIAFTDPATGTDAGPTESPFIVKRGSWYYLFLGPRPDHFYIPPSFPGTDVFASQDPFHFAPSQQVGHIAAHAAEVVDDGARLWVSDAGWGLSRVSLAPLDFSAAEVSGSALYALSRNRDSIWQWNGTGTSWTQIGGRSSQLVTGGFGTFSVEPVSGDIYRYDGSPNRWTRVGGSASAFAVNARALYRRDNMGVFEWAGSGTTWTKIGGPASAIYAAGVELYATSPSTGAISRYDGTPLQWTQIGGPGDAFAANVNGIFSLNFWGIYQWTGSGTEWVQIGGPANALYAGGNTLCAQAQFTGSINCYTNAPGNWIRTTGPVSEFAISDDGLFALRSSGVYKVSAGSTSQIRGSAAAIACGK